MEQYKQIWLRLGVSMTLSESEVAEIKKGSRAGAGIIHDKFNIGKCFLDGETYIPSRPGSDKEWPVENDIEFSY